MKIVGIIPARMASTRFPGKPLAKICGIPMIGHIALRSRMAKSLDAVYIATCDKEVVDYSVKALGSEAIMTSNKHERATDRAAEAIQKIEKQTGDKIDIVVMIQGDEPLVTPRLIDALVEPMIDDPSIQITNLIASIEDDDEYSDPNVVKAVLDQKGYALYFSREPIPSVKKFNGSIPRYKQLGIIAFRKDFLMAFTMMPPTPLEKIESIDMLRVLEQGKQIMTVKSPDNIYSVDTPEDLTFVESVMHKDPLFKKYSVS